MRMSCNQDVMHEKIKSDLIQICLVIDPFNNEPITYSSKIYLLFIPKKCLFDTKHHLSDNSFCKKLLIGNKHI